MAPPARPTAKAKPGPKPKAKPGPKPKEAAAESNGTEAAATTAKPKRNMRPKMPVFYEDIEAGTLMELGTYLGHTAEEALSDYLGKLDDDDRDQAHAAADYAVFTPDEGVVKLRIVPPTEPSIERR